MASSSLSWDLPVAVSLPTSLPSWICGFDSHHPLLCASGSVGGARPCQGRGRGFESRLALFFIVPVSAGAFLHGKADGYDDRSKEKEHSIWIQR